MSGTLATLAALLLIAVLITIHEFGHFLAAKACGVGVRVFSVGFGAPLASFKWRGTEYRLSWLPFGGYVRMVGADPFMEGGADEEWSDPKLSFMKKPPWVRLIILFAGPAMNLVLPFVVFSAIMVAGEPQARSDIGMVESGSVAERAGLRPEDRIVEVAGTPVKTWIDVADVLEETKGDTVPLVVDRAGERVEAALPVAGVDVGAVRDTLDFGLSNLAPDPTVVVDDPASPAGKAGMKSFDLVTAVAGQEVRTLNEVRRLLLAAEGPVELSVRHNVEGAAVETVTLRPDPAWQAEATDADDALWRRWGLASANVAVASFSKESAAQTAGVQLGDRLLVIDGRPIRTWYDVVTAVAATGATQGAEVADRPLQLTLRRDGRLQTLSILPKVVRDTDQMARYRTRPLLGLGAGGDFVSAPNVPRPYPLPTAMARASRETTAVAGLIVEQLGKLFTNEAALKDSLGGPVEIFRQTRAAAQRGLFDWARHMGLFSISLGILNLVPVPVLDGGQMLIYFAEWVRGRPLPLVLRERALQAGILFIVLLFLFVLVNDLSRWVQGA